MPDTAEAAATSYKLATKDGRANLIRAFKASGCAKCGIRFPEIAWEDLVVHHIDPTTKYVRSNGGHGLVMNNMATERLLAELLKCKVLCRQHHTEEHRNLAPLEGQLPLFSGSGAWNYSTLKPA